MKSLGTACENHFHCDSKYCHPTTKTCIVIDDQMLDPSKSSPGLNAGTDAAIIIFILLLIFGILYGLKRWRRRRQKGLNLRSDKDIAKDLFSPPKARKIINEE